mmetsp:Transcript_18891/g.39294  ORF Transcript_18891/g.39294 Transcript_18891/m.39294 type:complete len:309 (+) Transcript_18891:125-1051(+)
MTVVSSRDMGRGRISASRSDSDAPDAATTSDGEVMAPPLLPLLEDAGPDSDDDLPLVALVRSSSTLLRRKSSLVSAGAAASRLCPSAAPVRSRSRAPSELLTDGHVGRGPTPGRPGDQARRRAKAGRPAATAIGLPVMASFGACPADADAPGCAARYTAEQARRLGQRRYGYTVQQREQLRRAFRGDRELWEAALLFDPIGIDEALARLRDAVRGFSLDKRMLEDFFFEEGMLFSYPSSSRAWRKWRQQHCSGLVAKRCRRVAANLTEEAGSELDGAELREARSSDESSDPEGGAHHDVGAVSPSLVH